MASERICYTCGTKYEYCTRCSKYASQPKWRWMWDTEECKELYDAISGYKMNISDASAIKYVLDKYNITDYSKYTDGIAATLNDLFSYKKSKKNKKKEMDIELKEEITTDEPIVEEILTPIVDEISEINGISDLF